MQQIVIPMAGDGKRFTDAGFDVPKYLISVFGQTLLERSVSSMPLHLCENLIFIIKKEHEHEYNVTEKIRNIVVKGLGYTQQLQYLLLDKPTRGQTETVYKAKHLLDPIKPLIIFNADTEFEYDWLPTNIPIDLIDNNGGIILAVKQEGEHWSFAKVGQNGYVTETAEKQRISDNALVGFYHFNRASYFFEAAENQIESEIKIRNEFYVAPLYNYLIQHGGKYLVKHVKKFIPLGTPEEIFNYVRSRTTPTKPRSFNDIKIEDQVLFKTSATQFKKLQDEFEWYTEMSNTGLKKYMPQVFNSNPERKCITMEQIPMKSLSEAFLYDKLTPIDIDKIIFKLFDVLKDFEYYRKFTVTNDTLRLDMAELYKHKTQLRIREIHDHGSIPPAMLFENFIVNGNEIKCLSEGIINKLIKELEEDFIVARIHGDFCLSNILYSLSYNTLKLIDPRGITNNADQRYDLAKLRHSFSGYDLIINNYFDLQKVNDHSYEYNIFWNSNFNKTNAGNIDYAIRRHMQNRPFRQVEIIEALLFLTMIPLHPESARRQKMFYILAMEKFTKLINEGI